MLNNLISNLENKIKNKEENSPSLFVGKNLELVNLEVKNIALLLLKKFKIPNNYLYTLEDTNKKIILQEIKEFIVYSRTHPGYDFQIFFIQNISRLTITSANSLLKFFEEPKRQNIIFLTNTGENGVLDTILSRVKVINLGKNQIFKKDNFYYDLIKNYVDNKNPEIISYFFRNNLEKDEIIKFLENIILYAKENFIFLDILEEIDDDIRAIKQNNVGAKYIVDKYLLKKLV